MKRIWTIGHSTKDLREFTDMLQFFEIKKLIDVRSYPGSKKFPHFNKEALNVSMKENSIEYIHMPELGGRRKPFKESKNTVWKNKAFRGYADYMETPEFNIAIKKLIAIAINQKTAYMCSEALWWKCHRSLISDYLKAKDWEVLHIMYQKKIQTHPFTSPARVIQGTLDYSTKTNH